MKPKVDLYELPWHELLTYVLRELRKHADADGIGYFSFNEIIVELGLGTSRRTVCAYLQDMNLLRLVSNGNNYVESCWFVDMEVPKVTPEMAAKSRRPKGLPREPPEVWAERCRKTMKVLVQMSGRSKQFVGSLTGVAEEVAPGHGVATANYLQAMGRVTPLHRTKECLFVWEIHRLGRITTHDILVARTRMPIPKSSSS